MSTVYLERIQLTDFRYSPNFYEWFMSHVFFHKKQNSWVKSGGPMTVESKRIFLDKFPTLRLKIWAPHGPCESMGKLIFLMS